MLPEDGSRESGSRSHKQPRLMRNRKMHMLMTVGKKQLEMWLCFSNCSRTVVDNHDAGVVVWS